MAEETGNREAEAEQKKRVSRRGFLKTAAVGAAAAGFATTAPRILTGESGALSGILNGAPSAEGGEPIVAYIGDARSGEIVVMAGTREVRIRDFGMVSWLVRAVAGV